MSPLALFSFDRAHGENMALPDTFISHPAFVEYSSESAGIPSLFPAGNPIQMESGIMNFELKASTNALNRLIVELLACRDRIKYRDWEFVCRGLLAVRKGFWLVSLLPDYQVTVEVALWNATGSAERLSDFFAHANPTAKVLEQLLRDMRLRLDDGPACFLGSGRLGSVFRVCSDDGLSAQGCKALKVVAGSSKSDQLEEEYISNKAIRRLRRGVIVEAIDFRRYEPDSNYTEGAGMLMDEVGSKVSRSDKGVLSKALRALAELHQTGYWHGSARRDNLLACGDRLKWCDVQRADTTEWDSDRRYYFRSDLEDLLQSFGLAPSPDHSPKLPPTPEQRLFPDRWLDDYIARPTVDGLRTHADRIGFDLELDGEDSDVGAASADRSTDPL